MQPIVLIILVGLVGGMAIGVQSPMSSIISQKLGMLESVFIIHIGGARVIRRIVDALPSRGQARMRMPIIVYSTVISVMLLSAMIKLMDLTGDANAALLVSGGAFLFYISDIILAWNKFVALIQYGRIYNIAAYHLGQIMLIAGVIAQFG